MRLLIRSDIIVLIAIFVSNMQVIHSLTRNIKHTSRYRWINFREQSSLKAVKTTSKQDQSIKIEQRSVIDQVTSASIASAAVIAATAVNAAVSMKQLSAPDAVKSYVYRDGASTNRAGIIDEVGLPLVYDKVLIESYWKKQGSALTQRWTEFLGYAVPYLTKVIAMVVRGGSDELRQNSGTLAQDARIIFEKLGPTYVKLGQMMSVRPDVLPKEALKELQLLQDSVKPFDTKTAIEQIESELGGKLNEFFSEISEKPVAAASLAQVYRAKLASTGEYVAVKIQRPKVLETVSKDLYVLRRAAEVYQGLIDRFLPQQKTNYVDLMGEWALGFYTELDFLNEAGNQKRLKSLLNDEGVTNIYIPKVYEELCTRRVLVSEWIDGIKLSDANSSVIKELIPSAQEAFLTQLLQVGFLHADPHPGNLMYLNEPIGDAKLALIDFGLVASIKQKDMDTMISCIIHLANKDYTSLVDDFIELGILPPDCDRIKVIPLMDKALTPYVKGGGAQRYEEEIRKTYGLDGTMRGTAGGFQAMTQDALTVMNDIPFSIPSYFALLGRAIVTLEGIALTGDPSYGIIMEAYPFVARKLLSEDRPEIQKALQQVLYNSRQSNDQERNILQATRLSVLINSALGIIAKNDNVFIDFDSLPKESVTLESAIKLILSKKSKSLRGLLMTEVVNGLDILLRQFLKKSLLSVQRQLSLSSILPSNPISNLILGRFDSVRQLLPRIESTPIPILIPSKSLFQTTVNQVTSVISKSILNVPSTDQVTYTDVSSVTSDSKQSVVPVFIPVTEFIDTIAPRLSREEELYALSLTDLVRQSYGPEMATAISGDRLTSADLASFGKFAISLLSLSIQNNRSASDLKPVNSQILRFANDLLNNLKNILKWDNQNMAHDLVNGINNLSDDEKGTLQQSLREIVDELMTRFFDRLESKYVKP